MVYFHKLSLLLTNPYGFTVIPIIHIYMNKNLIYKHLNTRSNKKRIQ